MGEGVWVFLKPAYSRKAGATEVRKPAGVGVTKTDSKREVGKEKEKEEGARRPPQRAGQQG